MSRRYSTPIDVAMGCGRDQRPQPRTFRWHGRRYVVTEVIACWHERHAWWRDLHDGRPDSATGRDIWRVEARCGSGSRGVFDLGAVGDLWHLLRSHD